MKVYQVSIASSPEIRQTDTFPSRVLIRVDNNVFPRVNLPKSFANEEAGDPIGASDLKANLWPRRPNDFLKKITFFL